MFDILTEEQQDFARSIDDFCAREVGSVEKRGQLTTEGGTHSPEIYAKMAELGWLGLTVPEEYGGADAGAVELCLLLERSLRGLAPIGGIGPTLITAAAIQKFGTEEQRKRALELVVAGGTLAISMSEPGAGSDVAALRCKAVRDGDDWVITGQKTWCSNAHFADRILLVARTDSTGAKHEGITMFDVPADVEGLQMSGIDTMGGREVNDLYFTDVRLPAESVIGEVGGGWKQLMAGLNIERLILAAMQLGVAQRAFDDCLTFIREREQFGRPVGSFQVIRHRMADLATEIEATRLLVYAVARKVDESDPAALLPREASMAKLKATELSKRVTLECMQSMGGYGYATEYGMERLVRQAVVSTIYGGTNEIQRDIIGKTYGL
ncbi:MULTISPECIES: acyl-CoA dehydrogenase family protein [unclassified Dietzia]|uniref:acyl-CoA dehydrogenase family protein n=1 Tax=unclassified Dietzia TaxID=2617939 RepID=UPI000D20C8A0|nr:MULTISPECIES: acyl-CoA dehydrogenase family protein [unclassified Dietzia]AVZ40881.1 acyl-CoA dehydrogenase [Dietzia sp. JS16-p6b]MBB1024222.1 acyl-CoA/acyl-ACP dehydrogenase [Dietzia sp. DQ12-76]MBB1026707.1 acyl-CoA/acyl-ACP dehydrogenase [Dietzia sp. DQ11-38-2]QGW26509.1 acyl-CoA dehydrogenase [Dietzia sp. DQ12-45-1b]